MEQIGGQQEGATERAGIRAATEQSKLEQQWAISQQTNWFRQWKEKLDVDTRLRIAAMMQGRAPANILTIATFAQGGLTQLQDAKAAMQRLEQRGVMGQNWAVNKVEDWVFGAGAVDPNLDPETRRDIGILRSSLGYTSSATMRAHTGRSSQEMYQDFKRSLGPGQDWNALQGAIQQTDTLLGEYVNAASNANIMRMRTGGGPAAPTPPAGGTPPPPPGAVLDRPR